MKTKLFLAALAIPAVFAACSQDEFENVNETTAVTGIAIGDDLTFNVSKGDAETRLTPGAWEANDIVGMAWTTEIVKGGSDDDATLGRGTKAYANHPLYFTEGSAFKSKTMMYVGSYIAYYPFNEGLKAVGDLTFEVKANQTYKDADDFYRQLIFASDSINLVEKTAGNGTTPDIILKQLSNRLALDLQYINRNDKMKDPITVKAVKIVGSSTESDEPFAVSVTAQAEKWPEKTDANKTKKALDDMTTGNKYLVATTDKAVNTLTATPAAPLEIAEANANSALDEKFVYFNILPGVDDTKVSSASLVIVTNYGEVTVDAATAIFEKNTSGKFDKGVTLDDFLKEYALKVGNSKQLRVVVDMTKAKIDEMTATDADEIEAIVENWKILGGNSLTINVTHKADYLAAIAADANIYKNPAKAKNIVLDGLDLSSIPGALTLVAADTLVFTGTTNLATAKAANSITIKSATSMAETVGKAALIFNGTTTLGNLTAGVESTDATGIEFNGTTNISGALDAFGKITFNEANTTLTATLTHKPAAATDVITVEENKKLTISSSTGKLKSDETDSKICNGGTIDIIGKGAINESNAANLAIENFTEKTVSGKQKTVAGQINIGSAASAGYLYAKTCTNENQTSDEENGVDATVRFYAGEVSENLVTNGKYIAVVSSSLQFEQVVKAGVTLIEVIDEVDFGVLGITNASTANVTLKSGGSLNLGADKATIQLGNLTVEENAEVKGNGTLTIALGELAIEEGATLTIGENTTIKASKLNFPVGAKITGTSAEKSVLEYITGNEVGGTYDKTKVTVKVVTSL